MFNNIFHYLDKVINIIAPRQLIYFAIGIINEYRAWLIN
jgi:5'-3' exonuclease